MTDDLEIDRGTPGASGRREHQRRREKREAAVRQRHPRMGSLMLRFQDPPRHEQAWATGAAGEEELAAGLARRCPEAIVLHDRRLPGSRANVDHLAVASSGVYVIDAKRYKGKIEVRKPFFAEPQLVIAGRDRTKLVAGLERQVEAVRAAMNAIGPEVPVRGCFCFLNPAGQSGGTGIPLLRTLSINDLALYYPRKLAKRLNGPGQLDGEQVRLVARSLADAFPSA